MEKKIILYRKGLPRGSSSEWFDNLMESVMYDGPANGQEIFSLILDEGEFRVYFRQNGARYVLREHLRRDWPSLASKVRQVPGCLAERI